MTEQKTHKLKRRKRTEDIGVKFSNGFADDWFFGVPEVFKEAMDIRLIPYVDKEPSKKLRQKSEPKVQSDTLPTVYVSKLTIGIPPARNFRPGDLFYHPIETRLFAWEEALKILKYVVQVKDAVADDDATGTGGWVEYECVSYHQGEPKHIVRYKSSQAEFESFLKHGPTS